MSKTRNIIGWVLAILIGGFMLYSAYHKLAGGPEADGMAAAIGFTPEEMRMIGILEIASVLLFLIPRTGLLGTLLLAAYLGGAIATHLEHPALRASVGGAIGVQMAVWITALIRFPELGSRLFGRRPAGY